MGSLKTADDKTGALSLSTCRVNQLVESPLAEWFQDLRGFENLGGLKS